MKYGEDPKSLIRGRILIKFILVRHGETEWNRVRRIQGSASDTPLSETGKRQAECLALRLKDEKIQAIYSSPLQRALDTAQAIAHYHQLAVTSLPSLKEIDVGELEGVLSAELRQRFDELICRNDDNQEWVKLPGGESVSDVQKRAWETVKSIAAQHSEGTVVVVTHYFVIMAIVCQILNLPLCQIVRLRLSTGSISAFTLDGADGARLELFNDGCHNPPL
jgi:broad specificity phosphatase PhoE